MSSPRIDLGADWNQEDDQQRCFAHLDELRPGLEVAPGTVLVTGREHAWGWALVDEVDTAGGWIYFTATAAP